MTYAAPIKDIRFALEEIAAIDTLKADGGFEDLSEELIGSVLEEAGKLASDVLAPMNATGDRDGAKLVGDAVRTTPGFKEAYKAFAGGGWMGLSANPQHGGAGLPRALASAVFEMVHGANMAFGLAPTLSLGAIEALEAHGDARQKALYLTKIVSGEWLATMNLTEPHAGSDVGALKTRAVRQPDGTYRLFGSKIFITWGEHDFTDNIVHLVLARTPDAPEGVRGISLFIAPKFLVNADGSLGARNDLRCVGLEHKLGIHGSPTCVMSYGEKDGAVAELVGGENQGMALMFTMMNAARVMVGVQGVGVAEHAYQTALAYARERRQGRAEGVDGMAPIIEHPDVRRTLWLMKTKIEAARAVAFMASLATDETFALADPEDRAFAKRREELLTPIVKAWGSDVAVEVASHGVQLHGGMGFIEETGAAQHYRDARITPIYEGTNGIQGIDFVGRKLPMENGLALRELIEDIRQTVEDCITSSNPELPLIGERLAAAVDAMEEGAAWMLETIKTDRRSALSGATPFLTLASEACGGWALAIGAVAAQRLLKEGDPDEDYLRGKIAGARFFAEAVLAGTPSRLHETRVGAELVFGPGVDALTSV